MTISYPPAFIGMRGTGDWATNQRPEEWRESILYFFPNGEAPLTAMLAKMTTEVATDPKFHWWTQGLPLQAAATYASGSGIYTDSDLNNAYVSGGTSGDYVYANIVEADMAQFREGHQISIRVTGDLEADVVTKLIEKNGNGNSSYLKLRLLEDDDNSTDNDMSDADRVLVSGNINSEGAGMPDAISYSPTEWYNNTQIFRTPLEITGTAMETKLRTNPQAYAKLQKETLQDHSVELEKAFWWGVPSVGTGTNGKPERTTMGIIPAIRGGYNGHGGNSGTVSNYVTDSAYAGKAWLAGGEDWLNEKLEEVFRYGKTSKMAFCGSQALMAINKIVQNNGDFMWGPDVTIYGINVSTWITPLGRIALITHPLFNHEETTRRMMVIIEPENLIYRPIKNRDTKFIGETIGATNTGYARRDGIKEEFLTEVGLEYHHPLGWAFLTGFGSANTAAA